VKVVASKQQRLVGLPCDGYGLLMVAFHVRNVPEHVAAALRERASRHGHSLQQELLLILESSAAESVSATTAPSPIRLKTVRTTGFSTWSRDEIYDGEAT